MRSWSCHSAVCPDSLPLSSQTGLFMDLLICPDGTSPTCRQSRAGEDERPDERRGSGKLCGGISTSVTEIEKRPSCTRIQVLRHACPVAMLTCRLTRVCILRQRLKVCGFEIAVYPLLKGGTGNVLRQPTWAFLKDANYKLARSCVSACWEEGRPVNISHLHPADCRAARQKIKMHLRSSVS